MKKLLDFGRKALFYVRVLSGYEERRIRAYRLHLEDRVKKAQEKQEALSRVPEQVILAEVRRVVQEMQNLKKHLDDAETAIDNYFKPLDHRAEVMMKTQLDEEEKSMKLMVKAMQEQAYLEQAEAERNAKAHQEAEKTANPHHADANQQKQDIASTSNADQPTQTRSKEMIS